MMNYNSTEFIKFIIESDHFDAEFFSQHNGLDSNISRLNLIDKYLTDERYISSPTAKDFDGERYFRAYPEVASQRIPALLHYEMFGKAENRNKYHFFAFASSHSPDDFNLIFESNLFDFEFYKKHYMQNPLATKEEAVVHYLTYSSLDCRSPSLKFDASRYYQENLDVELSGVSALLHFEKFGRFEGRKEYAVFPETKNVSETKNISELDKPISDKKVAIVLHIFYPDFVEKFIRLIEQAPFKFDLFVTTPFENVALLTQKYLAELSCGIEKCEIRITKNVGRNFGPWLVEFSKELIHYDYIGHAHSKKSLYSGREQIHWSSHTFSGVLNSPEYMVAALNLLEHSDVNYVCSEPFYSMPFWAQHWLKNFDIGKHLSKMFDKDITDGFLDYPVGGMFWIKRGAIECLLRHSWEYDDFPAEVGQTDGTLHHAIERFIGVLCTGDGQRNAVWSPKYGQFRIARELWRGGIESLSKSHAMLCIAGHEVVSFDIFDTLVYRSAYKSDFARQLMESDSVRIKIIPNFNYKTIRELAESNARERKNTGDVNETEIAIELAAICEIDLYSAKMLMDREFELDLQLMRPRMSIVSIYLDAIKRGKNVILVSDMYYSEVKIRRILEMCQITLPQKIFVSSVVGKRKDTGEMWDYLKETYGTFLHFGDNVVSDIQNSTERGISCVFVPSIFEKVKLIGITLNDFDENSWSCVKEIVMHYGESPFFS